MNQHPPSEDTGAFPPHRESPSWGSSDCSSQGGHQGGARPLCADGSAGRFQEPPPHLLRPEAHFARLSDPRGNQNVKGLKSHSKDPQVNPSPLIPWGGRQPRGSYGEFPGHVNTLSAPGWAPSPGYERTWVTWGSLE